MYNDYYLEQINGKIATTNSKIDELIENQESILNNEATIIVNQERLISGDQEITEQIVRLQGINAIILIAAVWYIIYEFIGRCMKN